MVFGSLAPYGNFRNELLDCHLVVLHVSVRVDTPNVSSTVVDACTIQYVPKYMRFTSRLIHTYVLILKLLDQLVDTHVIVLSED